MPFAQREYLSLVGSALVHTIAKAPRRGCRSNIWVNVTTPYMPIIVGRQGARPEPFLKRYPKACKSRPFTRAHRPKGGGARVRQIKSVVSHLGRVVD